MTRLEDDLKAHLTFTAVTLALSLLASVAFATPAEQYATALAKMKAGDYQGAIEASERGYHLKPEQRFLFVKARANDKLGRHEAAWAVMKLIQPGNLPQDQQELFVTEYERMEREGKERAAKAARQAEEKRIEAEVQRRLAAQRAVKKPPAVWRWIASAGCAGTGIALTFLGRIQAFDANEKLGNFSTYDGYESSYGQSQAIHGVGIALGAVGVGALIWTLIDHLRTGSASPAPAALQLSPVSDLRRRHVGLQLQF